MKNFQVIKNKQFLQKHIGDMSQIAGLKRYSFSEGKAKGIEAVDFKTGSGFHFTVLPGRGMDIAWAEYKGTPVSYISKTGIIAPSYFESDGKNWLRSFFAGLLTTCGLSNAGDPCEDEDPIVGTRKYGLHGRISNMGADNVCVKEEWQGDDFVMSVSGRVRESMLFCENLTLKREITSKLGANSLIIKDTIENEAFIDWPLMLLYHINIGYPLVDEKSRFICNINETVPVGSISEEKKELFSQMHSPAKGEREQVFFHDLKTDNNGMTCCGIINPDLELGVYLKYKKTQLPKFTQWKMMGESEYVMGIEPGNTNPTGLSGAKKKGSLEYLEAGQKKEIELEIGILSTQKEIEEFTKLVSSLT